MRALPPKCASLDVKNGVYTEHRVAVLNISKTKDQNPFTLNTHLVYVSLSVTCPATSSGTVPKV